MINYPTGIIIELKNIKKLPVRVSYGLYWITFITTTCIVAPDYFNFNVYVTFYCVYIILTTFTYDLNLKSHMNIWDKFQLSSANRLFLNYRYPITGMPLIISR